MPVKFNPFTGQLQIDEKGSGGSSYIDGEVATYNDLPLDGTAALDSAWLVREASGVWPVSRKQAGIYIRTATAGSSRDADYTYAGTMPDVFSDAVFTLYDDASTTRTGQFNLGSITAGQNRVLTWPDSNGTIARTEDFAAPPAIGSTTRNTGAFTTLNATNGTITASAPVLDLSQTWNNAAVAFTGLRFNVTNTASASGTMLADFQVGGTSVFSVGRTGIGVAGNNWATFSTTFGSAVSQSGVWFFSNQVAFGVSASLGNGSGAVQIGSGDSIGWSSATQPATANADVRLFRDAADTLAQRRTTNAQTFRLYNTFTDASNYERGFMRWSSNVLQIGTEKGGTGSARALELQTDGTSRLTISTAGVFQFGGTTSSFPALKRSSTALQVRLADDSADAPLSAASITLGAGTATVPSFALSGSAVGIYQRAAGELTLTDGIEPQARYFSNFIILNSDFAFAWGSSTSAPTGADTILRRDAAGTLAQYNGVNAQAYRLYNTFTSSTNFERLNVRWASNECIIDAEAGSGGGTLRGIKIGSATSSLLGFYGVTPVDQPATVADPAGGGTVDTEARTAINAIIDRLQELGLVA